MTFVVTNSSKTTLPNNRSFSTNDTTSLTVALRASQQFYSAARLKSEYSGVFNSFGKQLNSALENALVRELGGGKIREGSGGFYPDYFLQLEDDSFELREQKLVATKETEDGQIIRTGPVKIGGGLGLTIKPGSAKLVTGFELGKKGITPIKKEVSTTRLVNLLKENANNQEALVRILSGKGQAATAIRTTLTAKASSIDIPVNFQGMLQNRTIRFTWKDITNAAITKKGKFTVIEETGTAIKLNFAFFGSTITKALNNMEAVIIRELKGSLGKSITEAIAKQASAPGLEFTKELRKFLEQVGFEYALKYIPGSAKIVSGKISVVPSKKKKPANFQKFISGAQWTVLTQQRLGTTMKRFGPPDPPEIKERSGRFRSSVSVLPDYRRGSLYYTYNPLYLSLAQYGYRPDIQVESAIRDVAQSLYSRQFNITKV